MKYIITGETSVLIEAYGNITGITLRETTQLKNVVGDTELLSRQPVIEFDTGSMSIRVENLKPEFCVNEPVYARHTKNDIFYKSFGNVKTAGFHLGFGLERTRKFKQAMRTTGVFIHEDSGLTFRFR